MVGGAPSPLPSSGEAPALFALLIFSEMPVSLCPLSSCSSLMEKVLEKRCRLGQNVLGWALGWVLSPEPRGRLGVGVETWSQRQ